MIHTNPILVIAGSVRPQRISLQVADWIADQGRNALAAEFEVVDRKDWPLPMDDEPGIPAAADDYACEHTRAWSRKIAGAAAVIFVTPQYNWGYPAALKNALDHLYKEWSGKPAMIVTFGGHGGDRCAAQLREVCTALHMALVAANPGLILLRDQIVANTGEIDPPALFAAHQDQVQQAFGELAAALQPA